MKIIILVFFTLTGFNAILAQRFDIQFMLDGKLRDCILVKPDKSPPKGGYPVVFMLHSSAHDGEEPYNISGWKELGEQENFISVFPSALKWCINEDGTDKYFSRWVNGNVTEFPCTGPPQDYIDDVKFIKILVTKINDTLPINLSRVYASGFSNGSAMIHKLAMEAGDVFAAVGGSGGHLAVSDSVINPVKRIPVWFMVGNQDPNYIFPNFSEVPFGGDSVLTYLKKPIHRIQACQGLTESFTKNELPITHTYIFNESQASMTSRPYLFTLIKGMDHMFPNGTNFPVEAARLFWEFFKQTTVVNTEDKSKLNEFIKFYPNPSSITIHVSIQSENSSPIYNLKVLNCLGQIVYKEDHKNELDFILEKYKTGSGLFFLQIDFGNHVLNAKVIFE